MAYYGQGQYGYAQAGYGNQNYAQQYGNYSGTATSDSQANYAYSNAGTSTSSQQASSQSYGAGGNQQYSYGYSSTSNVATTTSTTSSQQGNAYQQFSNLWYNQSATATASQSQQSATPQQTQQQQGTRPNQQNLTAAYQAQLNYYQQQSTYAQQQQQYQQGSQTSHQPYKAPASTQQTSTALQSRQQSSSQNQASSDWSSSPQQRATESFSPYSSQTKASTAQSWAGYSPQQAGKDWSSSPSSYQQQSQQHQSNATKNAYQSSGGGDYNYSQQSSSIQSQPQMYTQQQQQQQQQRTYHYQQQQQVHYPAYQATNQRAGSGNPPEGNRGYGGERGYSGGNYGGNQDSRGNYNSGPGGPPNNSSSASGQGNWGQGGAGGWGDWNGPRNMSRRSEGPHIPPFPPAWQMEHSGPQQPPIPQGGNRLDQNRGNWSGGNNWKQGWENQGGGRPGGNSNRFSKGDGQQNNRFQGSGRYSPNSRQSRGAGEKSNRELWTPGDSKRGGGKDKQAKGKDSQDVDKPIQATEIKAYLYAWLGVRRMRPLYDIHPVGERPDLTFKCELRVDGYKFVGVGEAASKKDAQTDAAWNFADFLVKQGLLKRSELPSKSKTDDDATADFGTVKEYEQEKEKEKEKPKPNRNRQPRNLPKGPIPPLMSIVTTPMGNIPPFPAYERGPDAWGMPPPRRGGLGPWMEGPGGPFRGGPRRGRGGWHRQHDPWRQRELEEDLWLEEFHPREFQHPEDMIISHLIMNQQEATMGARRMETSKPGEWTSVAPPRARNVATLDDRHVMAKHAAIYPLEEELKSIHQMVTVAERALKALSDQFVDEDHPLPKDEVEEEEEEEATKKETEEKKEGGDGEKAEKKAKIQILKRPKKRPRRVPDTRPRVLCAVNRVGTLAKGLLIHENMHVSLVLLCGEIPTKDLLQRIMTHLPAKIAEANKDLKYELEEEEAGFKMIGHFDVTVTLSVTLTCTSLKPLSVRETQEKGAKEETKEEESEESKKDDKNKEQDTAEKLQDPPGMLPKPNLLGALATLRHAKWFQARASQQDGGVVITRILRDMKMRNATWSPISNWALENLVYISLSSSTEHMSPGDALRRFFEVVAGGVLLKDRSGIQDPCEKGEVDVLDCCTEQQLEDMTRHAQNSLLKIAFRKIHEVLEMEKIDIANRFLQMSQTSIGNSNVATATEDEEREGGRKRRLEINGNDSQAESPKRSLTDEEDTDTPQNLAELTISDPAKSKSMSPIAETADEKPPVEEKDGSTTIVEKAVEDIMETDA